MTESMHTYAAAVRGHAESEQARLDRAALDARAATVAAYRALAVEGVAPDSPAYPVCALVAQTITVGREDGYPAVSIPDTTRAVVLAAAAAAVLPRRGQYVLTGGLEWHADISGLSRSPDPWQDDYAAWDEARTYAAKQTWRSL